MKIKKLFTIIISLLLVFTMMAGCSGSDNNGGSKVNNKSSSQSASSKSKKTKKKKTKTKSKSSKENSSEDTNTDVETDIDDNDQSTQTTTNDDSKESENDSNSSNNSSTSSKPKLPDEDEDDEDEDEDQPIPKNSIKILAIGNSYSIDTTHYLWNILKGMGYDEVIIGNMYIAGCPLSKHAENAKNDKGDEYIYYFNNSGSFSGTEKYTINKALSDYDWDFVSLQQSSENSGKIDTYNSDLDYLIGYIKTRAKNAKILWNMTWAYQSGYDSYTFSGYNKNQNTMYNSIVYCVQKKIKTNKSIYAVMPSGTAIQNARNSYLGDNLNSDGTHMNTLGRYITGLTWASVIADKLLQSFDYKDIYKPNEIDEKQKEVAIESAINALRHPFYVTPSKIK